MQLAVADAAVALLAAARAHKRSAAASRRHARDCMTALGGLRAACAALGIELEIRIKGEEGNQHGPDHRSTGRQPVDAGPVDGNA